MSSPASSPDRHARLMALFDQACDLGPAGAHAFLAALAPADAELREVLERMLEEDHRRQELLDGPRPGAHGLVGDLLGPAEGGSGAGRR